MNQPNSNTQPETTKLVTLDGSEWLISQNNSKHKPIFYLWDIHQTNSFIKIQKESVLFMENDDLQELLFNAETQNDNVVELLNYLVDRFLNRNQNPSYLDNFYLTFDEVVQLYQNGVFDKSLSHQTTHLKDSQKVSHKVKQRSDLKSKIEVQIFDLTKETEVSVNKTNQKKEKTPQLKPIYQPQSHVTSISDLPLYRQQKLEKKAVEIAPVEEIEIVEDANSFQPKHLNNLVQTITAIKRALPQTQGGNIQDAPQWALNFKLDDNETGYPEWYNNDGYADFFSESETRPCFGYVFNTYKANLAFESDKPTLTTDEILAYAISPVLCADNIIHQKEGKFIYRVSVDDNYPYYSVMDLMTGSEILMTPTILAERFADWKEKGLFKGTLSDKEIDEVKQKHLAILSKMRTLPTKRARVYPTFKDLYRLHRANLRNYQKFGGVRADTTSPTLCSENRVFSISNDVISKIELDKKMTFEKISYPHGRSLIPIPDFGYMLKSIRSRNIFDGKTQFVSNQILKLYQMTTQAILLKLNVGNANIEKDENGHEFYRFSDVSRKMRFSPKIMQALRETLRQK